MNMGNRKIYSEVKSTKDIRLINQAIRIQVASAERRVTLTKLYKRSMYLVTLTHTSAWKKAFAGKLMRMREAAKEEFRKTAKAINNRCIQLGLCPDYDEKWK
jgi:hypothetical protein